MAITIEIAITKIDYYNLCARTINNTYDGDALSLTPFLNAITLLESMDETNLHRMVLRDFILTKLKGIPLELLPPNQTIEVIKETTEE